MRRVAHGILQPMQVYAVELSARAARADISSRLEYAAGYSGVFPDRTFTCKNHASFRARHVEIITAGNSLCPQSKIMAC